jgi:hypothetical protein
LNIFGIHVLKTIKMKPFLMTCLALSLLLTACGVSSSTGDERKSARQENKAAEFEQVASLIESGEYHYSVRSATPTGGKTIQITSDYQLAAKEGIYNAYLPFFGRAYTAPYGGGGGIEFKGEPENLKVERNDSKYSITVSFEIEGENDRYNVHLEVSSGGYGTMVINSRNRASISYYGKITART